MTYDEYLNWIFNIYYEQFHTEHYKKYKTVPLRLCQIYYNNLPPDIASAIVTTAYDPYYVEGTEIPVNTDARVSSLWGEKRDVDLTKKEG